MKILYTVQFLTVISLLAYELIDTVQIRTYFHASYNSTSLVNISAHS